MLLRRPDARFTAENLARSLVFSAVAGLRLGMDILERERVSLSRVTGHGGFFKTTDAGQRLLAAALNAPVTVMESAGEGAAESRRLAAEGGAWGVALLAAYMAQKDEGETLEAYLENKVFAGAASKTLPPDEADRQGFLKYMELYKAGLQAVKTAADIF